MSNQNLDKDIALVVDDSRTMRLLMRSALESAGFVVYEAEDGASALTVFAETKPDIILLDLVMAGMDGFTACAKLRELPGGEHVPIVITTASEDVSSIDRAFNVKATDFITKPINWDLLGHRVRYIIRNSRDYFELQEKKIDLQKTQQELKKLNLELEQRVELRTEELRKANDELVATIDSLKSTQKQLIESEKMASLGNLVAGVAHEVNTPLGISVLAVTQLNETLEPIYRSFTQNLLKKSELTDFFAKIQEAIELLKINLNRAVDLIVNFKQVSVDQVTEQSRQFSLKEYLEEIIFSLAPALKDTALKTMIECPEDLLVYGYPGVIFRAITVMVMNSIIHGFDPGQSGTLNIEASSTNGGVELKYSDNGKGIASQNLQKIFEPFFTTKREAGCTGLGLHIVYNQISQVLNGSIKCESTLGKGTTFIINFPRSSH